VNLFILLLPFILVSCLDANKSFAPSQRLEVSNPIQAIEPDLETKSKAPLFVTFYWPKKEELVWSSAFFSESDSLLIRLNKIIAKVADVSKHVDETDAEMITFEGKYQDCKAKADPYYACVESDPEFGSEECLLAKNAYEPVKQECDDTISKHNEQLDGYMKSMANDLVTIQQAVDDPESVQPGSATKRKNWVYTGANKSASFKFSSDGSIDIKLKQFNCDPNNTLSYSTKEGDGIVDVQMTVNRENRETLHFTILEKNPDETFNGTKHVFSLEKRRFLNRVRFQGPVQKIDEFGNVMPGQGKLDLIIK